MSVTFDVSDMFTRCVDNVPQLSYILHYTTLIKGWNEHFDTAFSELSLYWQNCKRRPCYKLLLHLRFCNIIKVAPNIPFDGATHPIINTNTWFLPQIPLMILTCIASHIAWWTCTLWLECISGKVFVLNTQFCNRRINLTPQPW